MKTVACLIARTNSKRLKKKALQKIKGKRLIEYIIDKLKLVKNLDEIYLCTSIDKTDKILLKVAEENGIKGYAGDRDSVIDRMIKVGEIEKADNVVRVTGDNVFTDEGFLEKMIEEHSKNPKIDYTRTEFLPLGITAEVIKLKALKKCYQMPPIEPKKSEYLLLYMFNPKVFKCQVLIPPKKLQYEFGSLTVDTPEDWRRTKYLIEKLWRDNNIRYADIVRLAKKEKIPYFKMKKTMLLKMPNDKKITYPQFRNLLRKRVKESKKIYLKEVVSEA